MQGFKDSRIQAAVDPMQFFGVVQSKQLSTNDLAGFYLDVVVIICGER